MLRSINRCLKRLTQSSASRYLCTNATTVNTNIDSQEMSSNIQKKNRIVWIDLEMTGLDVDTDRILEVACLITDENLNIVSETNCSHVIHQPDNILDQMDEWCTEHHKLSGLTEASKKSTETEKTVDKKLLAFLNQYTEKGKCPMAGNSVYMDRLFVRKYLPLSNDFMHYRIIDVSSIKEVVKRWKPDIYETAPQKQLNHRAMQDIIESIQELDFYRKTVFNVNSN